MAVPTCTYKFLHERDLPFLLRDRTIRIGSSEHYRQQYAAMEVKDRKINDPDEGQVVMVQQRRLGPQSTEIELRNAERVGLPRSILNPKLIVEGNQFSNRLANFHMFCMGHGDHLSDLVRTFCTRPEQESGFEPYSACVEIDMKALCQAIFEGRLIGPGPNVPTAQVWSEIICGSVTYEPTAMAWHEGFLDPDPFRKDTNFEDQHEYRFVFRSHDAGPMKGVLLPDQLTAEVPRLLDVIKVVDLAPHLAGLGA